MNRHTRSGERNGSGIHRLLTAIHLLVAGASLSAIAPGAFCPYIYITKHNSNMETPEIKDQKPANDGIYKGDKSGRIMGGIILLIVGALLLAQKAGAGLPEWLFTWPMVVVAAGIFVGAKHRFRDWGWLFPVGVGIIFLLQESFTGYSWHNLWPIMIIIAGITMVFNSGRRRRDKQCW